VLEIHIDVRGFVALAADEALEQQLSARRIDLGDAEGIADRGVGGRTATLAQDAFPACELDQIVHRQEEVLVAQFRDQREFLVHQGAHRWRRTGWPAAREACLGQRSQLSAGRAAFRHDLRRILVAQLYQREIAALGDREALLEQRARVERAQLRERTQAALGVRVQPGARRINGAAVAHGGEHVLQRTARARVQVYIAAGNCRHAAALRQRAQPCEPGRIIGAAMQLDGYPGAPGEALAQPGRLVAKSRRAGRRCGRRHPERQAVEEAVLEIGPLQPVCALARTSPSERDQSADLCIGRLRGREQDQLQSAGCREFGTDDQLEPAAGGLREGAHCFMRPHRAGERALIGQRERAIAQRLGTRDQLCGV
jgi:hypothetical protein